MEDLGRTALVFKLWCSQCGSALCVSYSERPKRDVGHNYGEYDGEGVVTGCDKVETGVTVHPCQKCWREAKEPLENLRKAIAGVIE